MNKQKLGSNPAFPSEEVTERMGGMITRFSNHRGISKRFYAACAAMQGLLSNHVVVKEGAEIVEGNDREFFEVIIAKSFQAADEILKQENL